MIKQIVHIFKSYFQKIILYSFHILHTYIYTYDTRIFDLGYWTCKTV